jgi:hypothetical protein
MFGQLGGIAMAMGTGAGAAMAADELKVCAFGVPNRIAKTKAASTTVKVIMVLFIFPPQLKVCTTLEICHPSYSEGSRLASLNIARKIKFRGEASRSPRGL